MGPRKAKRAPFMSPRTTGTRRKKQKLSDASEDMPPERDERPIQKEASKETKTGTATMEVDDEEGEMNDVLSRILKLLQLQSPDDCLRVGALLRHRGLYKDCLKYYNSLERHIERIREKEPYHTAQQTWSPLAIQALRYNKSIATAHSKLAENDLLRPRKDNNTCKEEPES
eukprot:gb/GECG01001475.1/.p1 GENE.gb/GECG01001475.1/~~gb/GECG01001475.1/.p1  ORF type:complete len:171 (+),score=29.56 gb/GECG01001475.1/:1-513(+)